MAALYLERRRPRQATAPALWAAGLWPALPAGNRLLTLLVFKNKEGYH